MMKRLIDADELLVRMREKYITEFQRYITDEAAELFARMRGKCAADVLDDPEESLWLCELENVINDMTAAEHAAPDFTPCSHGDGVIVRPDGVHELSPHVYRLTERLRNVTVEILTCEECGDVSIAWYRQNDTEEAMDND